MATINFISKSINIASTNSIFSIDRSFFKEKKATACVGFYFGRYFDGCI